jgi:hypothetical protein
MALSRRPVPVVLVLAVSVALLAVGQRPAGAQPADDDQEQELQRQNETLKRQQAALRGRIRDLLEERWAADQFERLAIDHELARLREELGQLLERAAPVRRELAPKELPEAEANLEETSARLEAARAAAADAPDDEFLAAKVRELAWLVDFERGQVDRLEAEAGMTPEEYRDAGLADHDAMVERLKDPPPEEENPLLAAGGWLATLEPGASLGPGELDKLSREDPTVQTGLEPVEGGSRAAPAVLAARDRAATARRELDEARAAVEELPDDVSEAHEIGARNRLAWAEEELAAAEDAVREAELDLRYEQLAARAEVEGAESVVEQAQRAVDDAAGPRDFAAAQAELERARTDLKTAADHEADVLAGAATVDPPEPAEPAEDAGSAGADGGDRPDPAEPNALVDPEPGKDPAELDPEEGDPEKLDPADAPVRIGGLAPTIGWGVQPEPSTTAEPEPAAEGERAAPSAKAAYSGDEPLPTGTGSDRCGPAAGGVKAMCGPVPDDGVEDGPPVDEPLPLPPPLDCPDGWAAVPGPDGQICKPPEAGPVTTPPVEPPAGGCPDGGQAPGGILAFCPPPPEPGGRVRAAEQADLGFDLGLSSDPGPLAVLQQPAVPTVSPFGLGAIGPVVAAPVPSSSWATTGAWVGADTGWEAPLTPAPREAEATGATGAAGASGVATGAAEAAAGGAARPEAPSSPLGEGPPDCTGDGPC